VLYGVSGVCVNCLIETHWLLGLLVSKRSQNRF